MKRVVSPCHTTGPFFPREFSDGNEDLTRRGEAIARGQHIILAGRVLELGAKPTWNMVLEIWQADASGVHRHPLDPRAAEADPGFWNWGRARTDQDGWYKFRTVLPGSGERIPHINCAILGIGLTRRLVTTIFFSNAPDGAPGGAPDPVLDCVPNLELRQRLIARRDSSLDGDGALGYRFDVILRGDGETPFFVD